MNSKLPELICNDKGEIDGVFEVLIKTDYALYKFNITVSAFTMIRCSVARNGETEFEEYEYKSEAHAWAHFKSKMKDFLH